MDTDAFRQRARAVQDTTWKGRQPDSRDVYRLTKDALYLADEIDRLRAELAQAANASTH